MYWMGLSRVSICQGSGPDGFWWGLPRLGGYIHPLLPGQGSVHQAKTLLFHLIIFALKITFLTLRMPMSEKKKILAEGYER